jgi:outer membrane protease
LNYHKEIKNKREDLTVDIHKGVLNVDCKEDSLKQACEEKDSIITWQKTHSILTTNTVVQTVTKTPWWAKPCGWFTLCVLLLLAGYLLGKRFKIF